MADFSNKVQYLLKYHVVNNKETYICLEQTFTPLPVLKGALL